MQRRYFTPRVILYLIMLASTSAALVYQICRSVEQVAPPAEISIVRDWDEITRTPPLVIATDYGATTSRHDIKELEHLYRLAKFITKRTGIEAQILLEPRLDNLLTELEGGGIDLLAGHLPRTNEIDTGRFAWVRPTLIEPVLLVQRSDTASLIRSQLDLSGKVITLPEGSAYRIFVDHLAEEIGAEIYTAEYPDADTEHLLTLVQGGEADYTLCPSSRAKHYAELYPELDITLPITYSLRSGWVLRRSSPILKDSLSFWLKRMR